MYVIPVAMIDCRERSNPGRVSPRSCRVESASASRWTSPLWGIERPLLRSDDRRDHVRADGGPAGIYVDIHASRQGTPVGWAPGMIAVAPAAAEHSSTRHPRPASRPTALSPWMATSSASVGCTQPLSRLTADPPATSAWRPGLRACTARRSCQVRASSLLGRPRRFSAPRGTQPEAGGLRIFGRTTAPATGWPGPGGEADWPSAAIGHKQFHPGLLGQLTSSRRAPRTEWPQGRPPGGRRLYTLVIPRIVPRAWGSQSGRPGRVSAGTEHHPPLSGEHGGQIFRFAGAVGDQRAVAQPAGSARPVTDGSFRGKLP